MKTAWLMSTALVVAALIVSGCGQTGAPQNVQQQPSGQPSATGVATTEPSESDHSGWWCPEHGMPEEICAQCNSKLAAEFQKKGDWCKEHDRPDSQCFLCHPELQAKFAAQYRAKYGKEPPAIEEENGESKEGESKKQES
ncbi:MAG: hypothetical protein KatS3mg114_0936 [Planctomycetaceae bacterium]|jgi:hypothetical protein|nr:MAG: hypothetical protein KatS3mg114_0936 [Planctomycetaceae bacterium]